jgi:hypothetical protein
MSPDRTVRQLASLDQFQIDVAKAYDQALHHLDEPALREELYRIKADIERHVLEISEVLRALGHEPPAYARDLRGYLMACVTALRSADGGEGALRALRAIIEASLERYRQTLDDGDLPMEAQAMLEAHLVDLHRHHDALDGMLVPSGHLGMHSPPGEPDLTA